jgi:hypothetical protein
MLNDLHIRRVGGNEAQTDNEDQEDVNREEGAQNPPRRIELEPLEPEEDQVNKTDEHETDE